MLLVTSLSFIKHMVELNEPLTIPRSRCNSLLLRTLDQRTDDSGPTHSHHRKGSEASGLKLSHWEHTQAGRRSMFYKDMQWIAVIILYRIIFLVKNLYFTYQLKSMFYKDVGWYNHSTYEHTPVYRLSEEQPGREWACNRVTFSGKR